MTDTGTASSLRGLDFQGSRRGHCHAGWLDGLILQMMRAWFNSRISTVTGAEHITPENDPFILAVNHSTRLEAILVPALLMHLREGKHIHFMADWNFRLIPGVGFLYRRARVITVSRKPARPRFLNVLKPLFVDRLAPLDAARQHLRAGRSLGLFPEGTVNHDPSRLLRGRLGMTHLSFELGVPIIPAGIRFPGLVMGQRPSLDTPFELHIGPPVAPPQRLPTRGTPRDRPSVQLHHQHVMNEIGRLAGKS